MPLAGLEDRLATMEVPQEKVLEAKQARKSRARNVHSAENSESASMEMRSSALFKSGRSAPMNANTENVSPLSATSREFAGAEVCVVTFGPGFACSEFPYREIQLLKNAQCLRRSTSGYTPHQNLKTTARWRQELLPRFSKLSLLMHVRVLHSYIPDVVLSSTKHTYTHGFSSDKHFDG
jgi:hypothetical protein